MSYGCVVGPATQPLNIDDVISHLRLSSGEASAQQPLLQSLIEVATEEAEHQLGRALITQTWRLTLDALTPVIILPRQAVQSVESIKYLDASGVQQTLPANMYQLTGWDNRVIIAAHGATWPSVRGDADCVEVRWVAGYGAAFDDVPMPIRQWMLIRIGTLYEHREEIITGTMVSNTPFVDRLLDRYRVEGYL